MDASEVVTPGPAQPLRAQQMAAWPSRPGLMSGRSSEMSTRTEAPAQPTGWWGSKSGLPGLDSLVQAAKCQWSLGCFESCVDLCNFVLEMAPTPGTVRYQAHLLRGLVFHQLGYRWAAVLDLQKALALAPPLSRQRVGRCLTAMMVQPELRLLAARRRLHDFHLHQHQRQQCEVEDEAAESTCSCSGLHSIGSQDAALGAPNDAPMEGGRCPKRRRAAGLRRGEASYSTYGLETLLTGFHPGCDDGLHPGTQGWRSPSLATHAYADVAEGVGETDPSTRCAGHASTAGVAVLLASEACALGKRKRCDVC